MPLPLSILLKSTKGCRQIYDRIIHTNKSINSINKWSTDLQTNLNVRTDKLFYIPFEISNDQTLQWFQVRINHRILGTNVLLEKMKIKENKLCSYCKHEPETILHLFSNCSLIMRFWRKLEHFLQSNCQDISFILSATTVIFGDITVSDVINTILIMAKFYIFKNKNTGKPPHLDSFKKQIVNYYQTEKIISIDNMNINKFNRKWVPFLHLIQNCGI